MIEKLKLDTPLLVNGKKYEELEYDTSEITAMQFSEACMKASEMSKNTTSISFKLKENDYALHLYLGFMAVIAVNPEIDLKDLERIKGLDTLKFTDIGMLFIYRKSGGTSQESDSENSCETTPDTSTPALETSEISG